MGFYVPISPHISLTSEHHAHPHVGWVVPVVVDATRAHTHGDAGGRLVRLRVRVRVRLGLRQIDRDMRRRVGVRVDDAGGRQSQSSE